LFSSNLNNSRIIFLNRKKGNYTTLLDYCRNFNLIPYFLTWQIIQDDLLHYEYKLFGWFPLLIEVHALVVKDEILLLHNANWFR